MRRLPAPEVEVHERPHRVERLVVLGLPVPVELEPVRGGHLVVAQLPHPRQGVAVEGLHLLGGRVRIGHGQHGVRPALEIPVVQARRVGVMLLRIPAGVHVEHDPAGPVRPGPVVAEAEPQVGLADPGGPVDHGQGAGQQSPTQHLVELRTSGGNARGHRRRILAARSRSGQATLTHRRGESYLDTCHAEWSGTRRVPRRPPCSPRSPAISRRCRCPRSGSPDRGPTRARSRWSTSPRVTRGTAADLAARVPDLPVVALVAPGAVPPASCYAHLTAPRRARRAGRHAAQRVRPRVGPPRGRRHPARDGAAQPDRGQPLRRARHRRPAHPDPEQGARDHPQRRGLGLPRRGVAGRAGAAPVQAGPERLGPRPVHRVHPADRRGQRRRSRGPDLVGPPAGRRLRAAARLAVPDQPRVRRARRLPHPVDAGGADGHAPGHRDRRPAAHQLQARRLGDPRAARPPSRPRSSPTPSAFAASPPRSRRRPPSRSRTAACTSPSRPCSRASCRPRSPPSSRGTPRPPATPSGWPTSRWRSPPRSIGPTTALSARSASPPTR